MKLTEPAPSLIDLAAPRLKVTGALSSLVMVNVRIAENSPVVPSVLYDCTRQK